MSEEVTLKNRFHCRSLDALQLKRYPEEGPVKHSVYSSDKMSLGNLIRMSKDEQTSSLMDRVVTASISKSLVSDHRWTMARGPALHCIYYQRYQRACAVRIIGAPPPLRCIGASLLHRSFAGARCEPNINWRPRKRQCLSRARGYATHSGLTVVCEQSVIVRLLFERMLKYRLIMRFNQAPAKDRYFFMGFEVYFILSGSVANSKIWTFRGITEVKYFYLSECTSEFSVSPWGSLFVFVSRGHSSCIHRRAFVVKPVKLQVVLLFRNFVPDLRMQFLGAFLIPMKFIRILRRFTAGFSEYDLID